MAGPFPTASRARRVGFAAAGFSRRCGQALLALALGALLGSAPACAPPSDEGECSSSSVELFDQKVAPLLGSEHPNTCSQCHFGGIDLQSTLRRDACESMACLLQEGLVNLEQPQSSVLLTWIQRATPENELITGEVIEREHQALRSWIEAEAACRVCEGAVCGDGQARECSPTATSERRLSRSRDPGGCDADTMLQLFRGTVYEWRGRCSPCHFQEEETATQLAPRFFFRTGGCDVASQASYNAITASGLIDLERPEDSLLLLKPLAERDGGLPHGGHDKMVREGDPGFDDFRYFAQRLADCRHGGEP